ncbi:MAG: hypothetical protein P0116_15550 [Candidatus Nitrosocosmicus sp.]|nr:hypothetical protein [Candidatus Nitrosocosmicus sp.]
MKKKIRIIKNNDRMDQGTFFEPNSATFEPTNTHLESKRDDQVREKTTDKDKDKKKKVANKKDTTSRGLKYINPSQRNHSSIYE